MDEKIKQKRHQLFFNPHATSYLFDMKKIITFCLCLLLSSLAFAQLELIATRVSDNLDSPVDITNAGDDRLFIVEQGGTIKWLRGGTEFTDKGEFLDIDGRVRSGGERGLLGLAFHPDYANNGYFYVNYTNNAGHTVIARFSVSADDPDRADPDSEQILLTVEQPFSNHNGGDLTFGPDGYLYIGLGDGGAGGDPRNNSQDRQTLLGKMLRIDVDNGDPYAIPDDNPFAQEDFTLDEIWSLGWRNPWRFSFDRETGEMWIADVGQDAWEEIDVEPANTGGLNYGWRCFEGNADFNQSQNCPAASELTFPVHQYPKPNNGCISVTGGFVYRGMESPNMQGRYIYGDFCTGQFWSLTPNGDGTYLNEEFTVLDPQGNPTSGWQPSTFGEDVNGELYMADFNTSRIYQLSMTCPTLSAEIAADGANLTLVNTIENATYQWFLNDEPIAGATSDDYVALEGGDYYIAITTADGCMTLSNAVNVMVSTINTLENIEQFSLSPNPFLDKIELQMTVTKRALMTFQLLNIEGKIIQEWRERVNGNYRKTLNVSDLSNGIYLIKIKTKEGEMTRRLVK